MKIVQNLLPETQYWKQTTTKTMIVLHHTVSPGHDATGDIKWWLSTPDRVATHCIITQDGIIHKTIDSKYWGHHLGLKESYNMALNKASYSIELDSLGPVDKDGNSLAYKGVKAHAGVQEYPNKFRGYQYFEKYTPEQIEAARELIIAIGHSYDIPLHYNPAMWDVSDAALAGVPGVWSHVSFRKDKSDCHPQPELIEMLKSLQP
jgi:N-acetyl-anhydromuramyl-L-alanine amidase AmpD